MDKPFWHRLSLRQQRSVMTHKDPERPRLMGLPGGWTFAEFLDMYRQPRWCEYPNALQGAMGCWSLVYTDKKRIRRQADCGDCDCRKQVAP